MENAAFEEKDTQVLGISTDARGVQTAFAASLGNIPYPILSDFHPKGKVAQLYGVYNEERGTANRSVFLIDKQGVVRFKKIFPRAADLSVAEVLAEAAKLKR